MGRGIGAMACAMALAPSAAHAAAPDASFGIAGTAITPLSTMLSDRYYATAPAPGGGTYNVGYTSATADDRAFALSRVDADGKLVPSFGTGGVASVNVSAGPFPAAPNAPSGAAQSGPTGAAEIARGVAVQPDGKIVISGQAETPAASAKPDSRDLDVYVARFDVDGSLDTTFGVGGVRRVDLSDGVTAPTGPTAATTSVRTDQGYGLSMRPDGRLLVTGVTGSDSATLASRPDQDLTVVALTPNGDLDASFSGDGVATARTPGINENPRQGLVEADGSFVTTAYGSPTGTPTRPLLVRFELDGSLDTTFGTSGVASGPVGGAAGRAEVYGVVASGGKYVLAGYGSRNETPTNTDAIVYRFNSDGTWDQSFGRDGLVSYGDPVRADRARNITTLADGRIVAVGGTEVSSSPSNTSGLIWVLNPDGTPDTTVGPEGAQIFDLGGPGDFFYGVTSFGRKLVAAGYVGAASVAGDDGALVRLDLDAAAPVTVAGTTTPVTPAAPATPAPAGGVQGAERSNKVGRVRLTCKRTGAKRNRIRCVVTQSRAAAGTVRVSLKRSGARVVKGKATARRGKATVIIRSAKRARTRYTATLTLPTEAGTPRKLTRKIAIR